MSLLLLLKGGGSVGYTLTAEGGTYTLTGGSVTLLKSRVIVASGGSYTVAGGDVTILRNRTLTASGGSYIINGSSASYVVQYDYPPVDLVLQGIVYGPGGIYTGTYNPYTVKLNVSDGTLVKQISDKIVITL